MSNQTKSFWQRPEGKTGVFFLVAAVGLCVYVFSLLLPWLKDFVIDATTLAVNFARLGLVCAAIFAVLYVLADAEFRTIVSYGYKMAMRKLTGAVKAIDSIEIMKISKGNLSSSLEEMDVAIAELNGQRVKLRADIDENEKDRAHSLTIAGEAKKQGKKAAFALNARQAGRLRSSTLNLRDLLQKLDSLYARLVKIREVSDFLIHDMEAGISVAERDRNAIRSGHKAYKAGKSMIQGGVDKSMYDEASELVANDFAMKVGEIEMFMEASTGFIEGVDLENRAYEVEAMAELEKWDERIDRLIDPPQTRIAVGRSEPSEADVEAEADADAQTTSFTKFFKN